MNGEIVEVASSLVGSSVLLTGKDGSTVVAYLKNVVGTRLMVKLVGTSSVFSSGPVSAFDLIAIEGVPA